jgi:ribonuclease HIII
MESQSESIGQLLSQIDSLKANGKREELDEYLGALFGVLFRDDGLQSISSERILNQVNMIMSAYGVWQKYPREKDALDERISVVHAIHSRLYSVLDLRVDIDTLLQERLNSWPIIPEKLEVDFPRDMIEELGKIREESSSLLSDILNKFFQKYLDTLLEKKVDVSNIRKEVEAACQEYRRLEKHTHCLALFAERDFGVVSSIQVTLSSSDTFEVNSPTDIGPEMKKAAKIAIGHTLQILSLNNQYHIKWMIEHPRTYEGSSVGLPVSVALIKELTRIRVDCYSGFTGEIEFNTGAVIKVGHVKEKLQGAANFGLRRVFIPKENEQEVQNLSMPDLEIIFVESLTDTRSKLIMFSTPMIVMQRGPSFEAKIRHFEIKCKDKGVSVTRGKNIPFGNQFIASDFRNEIPVNIYHGRKGMRWVVGGDKESNLYGVMQQICIEVFGPINEEVGGSRQVSSKWSIKDISLRSTIKNRLQSLTGWTEESEKNCEYRLALQRGGQSVIVRQFTNGTLTVTGTPAGTDMFTDVCHLVELALGIPPSSSRSPSLTKGNKSSDPTRDSNRLSSSNKKAIPSHAKSWIGTDESGKGDYFGPLVSAGVCVNRRIEPELRALGVRDSKKLSDKNVREFAKMIRTICKGRYSEVPIPPQTYNNLYNQFRREGKTLNTLLAWGHARAIENILAEVPCEYALADQFADERFIISKLQEAGRKITLIQMPKAEQDIAVAAASILARDRFLFYLDRMNLEYRMQFPKGASEGVIKVAKEFLVKYGKDMLSKVAKLHFRTTKEVLG